MLSTFIFDVPAKVKVMAVFDQLSDPKHKLAFQVSKIYRLHTENNNPYIKLWI